MYSFLIQQFSMLLLMCRHPYRLLLQPMQMVLPHFQFRLKMADLDNDFATTEDNRQATHQVEVNVLEVISNQGSAILAKDGTENLYANTQPVTYQEQQVQSNIAGFAAIGATSEDGANALLVERASVINRLVTDDAWRINGPV